MSRIRDIDPVPTLQAHLGPTNTGKTHRAVQRMLARKTGMIGLPLRLLAREVYDRVVARVGPEAVALVTGEERLVPHRPRYWHGRAARLPTRGLSRRRRDRALRTPGAGAQPHRTASACPWAPRHVVHGQRQHGAGHRELLPTCEQPGIPACRVSATRATAPSRISLRAPSSSPSPRSRCTRWQRDFGVVGGALPWCSAP